MSSTDPKRLMAILEEVLSLPEARWPAYLAEVCEGDPQMRQAVEARIAGDWEAPFSNRPFAEKQDFPPLQQGTRLGEYTIVRKLGHGGMGTVYLAQHPYQKEVALKILKRGMDTDHFLARFHRERTILAELKHPNIARLLDAGATADGLPYFVMEYLDGMDIRDYVHQHQCTIKACIKLFLKVCAAVSFAHQNLVVHRDLKPSNILVSGDGAPKLLDFGIAKLLQHDDSAPSSKTATHLRLMTPEYASPEQLRGQTHATSSDIYSLGVLLFELLTGRRPFTTKEAQGKSFEKLVCGRPAPKPSEVLTDSDFECIPAPATPHLARSISKKRRKQLKGDLDTILLKALRKEPNRRYSSVDHLAEDLQRYLNGLPVKARKDTFFYRSSKFVRRHKLGLVSSLILALLPLTFATARLMERQETIIQKNLAMRERDKWERTTQFLMHLFELSDPLKNQGASITARELLDRAAAQLDGDLEAEFQVRADFMTTIGKVYIHLGQYEAAQEILEKSLKIQKADPELNPLDMVPALQALGQVHLKTWTCETGLAFLEQAKALQSTDSRIPVLELAKTNMLLAQAYTNLSRFPEAEALARDVLALREKTFGLDHPQVAEVLETLSVIVGAQGRHRESETIMRRDMAIREKAYGKDHPELLATLNNLAMYLKKAGDYNEAEILFKRAIGIMEHHYQPDHPDLAFAYYGLASNYGAQGRFEEAAPLYEKAVAIAEKTLKPDALVYTLYLNNWGNVLRGLKQYDRAEALIRKALAIRVETMGSNSPWVGNSRDHLGQVLREKGQLGEAERQFTMALATFEKLNKQEHSFAISICHHLGELQVDLGQFDRAIQNIQFCIQAYQKRLSPDHPMVSYMLLNLAKAYQGKHDFGRAEEACREALAIRDHHPDTFFLEKDEAKAFYAKLKQALQNQKG